MCMNQDTPTMYMYMYIHVEMKTTCTHATVCENTILCVHFPSIIIHTSRCMKDIMLGKCMHQKQPVIFNEKTKLSWAELEPAISHVLDG